MKVSFDIEISDLLAFNKYYLKSDSTLQRRIRMWQIVLPVIFVVMTLPGVIRRGIERPDIIIWVVGVFLALIYPAMVVYISQRSARRLYKRPENGKMRGNYQLSLSDEGLISTKDGNVSNVAWPSIVKWVETQNHFFLFYTGMTGLIIPKGALAPDEQRDIKTMFETKIGKKTK